MLNKDFREMLAELNAAGAEYLLVGAYALSIHGFPRATGDIDLWVRPTAENAAKVWSALKTFKAPTHHVTEADIGKPDVVFFIGAPPNRIDILTSISGVGFEAAWQNRKEESLSGVLVQVIGKDDLLVNKLASG